MKTYEISDQSVNSSPWGDNKTADDVISDIMSKYHERQNARNQARSRLDQMEKECNDNLVSIMRSMFDL